MKSTQTLKQIHRRAGAKWSINECLQLQREYELLRMPIKKIALKHERSVDAIMYKIDAEGWGDFNCLKPTSVYDDEDEDYVMD